MSINLSCAECNAIRPFSGGPPNWKCEVCGWELGTSSRRLTAHKGGVHEARPGSEQTEPYQTINISCADCNGIQPFSGGPPNWKCETCGWELGTPSRKPRPTASSKEMQGCLGTFGTVIGFGVLIVVALGALWGLIALVKWFWYHS